MREESMAQPAGKAHFEDLDGLRGVAALVVLFGHLTAIFLQRTDFFPRKVLAVNFFFMLSGFVISYSYGKRLYGSVSVIEFFARRAIRLYPLIVLGTLLGALSLALVDPAFFSKPRAGLSFVASILSLPDLTKGDSRSHFALNPPEWSLFYELLAYSAFALILQTMNKRTLVVIVVVGAVFYSMQRMVGTSFDQVTMSNVSSVVASFSLGLLVERSGNGLSKNKWALSFPWLSILLAGACAIPLSAGNGVDVIAVLVLFPALLVLGRHSTSMRGRRVVRWLGDLSFPVYILHWPLLLMIQYLLQARYGARVALVAGCIATLIGAGLAFTFFDLPLRRRLNTWLTRRLSMPVQAH